MKAKLASVVYPANPNHPPFLLLSFTFKADVPSSFDHGLKITSQGTKAGELKVNFYYMQQN